MITEYVAFFVGSFISILSIFISYKKMINEKTYINFKIIGLLILGSIITTLLFYNSNEIIKMLFSILFFVFIFKIDSKKQTKELFYYSVIIWIYGILIDLFNLILVSSLGLDRVLNNLNVVYVRIGSGLIMSILLILLCSLSFIKKFTNKTIEKLIKINLSIIIDIILILTLLFLSIISVINVNKITVTLFSVFIAMLVMIFIYNIINKNFKIKRLKETNKILIKNNEFYKKLDTDYRILKHNLTHQLQGIKSVSNDKSKELIEELILNYNSNFIVSKDINKVPDGINGIIYEKFYTSGFECIDLSVDNTITSNLIDVLKAKNFNLLCETLGVLVDNALEASNASEKKLIYINFSETIDNVYISISNTFNKNLDIDNLGSVDYTTKGKNRGIGLFSLFIKKDINISTKIINDWFHCNISVKK